MSSRTIALNGSIDPGFDEGAREAEDEAGLIAGSGFNSSFLPTGAASAANGVLTPDERKAFPLSF